MASVGSVQECTKIVQTRIRPHDPVRILVDRRPHLTKVLSPVEAKKSPIHKGGPLFPKPTWEEAKSPAGGLGVEIPQAQYHESSSGIIPPGNRN